MTKLGTTATVTRQIITPGQAPLQPFDEFERAQMRKNLDARLDECGYMRQTGRTTRLVIEALEAAVNEPKRQVVIEAYNQSTRKCIDVLVEHYAAQYGLDASVWRRIHTKMVRTPFYCDPSFSQMHLVDNSVTDVGDQKKTPMKPAPHLAGQNVNILIENVWIKRVEYAGGGSHAYQYIGQTKNGVEIAFTDDNVMKVVRKVD